LRPKLQGQNVTGAARSSAAAVAAAAGAGLAIQTWLSAQTSGSILIGLWKMAQFFTILTNALVFGTMLAVALGRRSSPRWMGGVLLAILIVGIVYHALLAKLANPVGLHFVSDQLMHTVSPIAMLLWWLAFGERAALRWSDALVWLLWPLGYCAYALVRAQSSGFYPYFFIDLSKLGFGGLAESTGLLALGFLVLGLTLIALAKVLPESGLRTGRRYPPAL
jgi:hypothetical protein